MATSLAGTGGKVGIILSRVPFGKRGGPARNMHIGIPPLAYDLREPHGNALIWRMPHDVCDDADRRHKQTVHVAA
jgi:hypothetical protein